MKLIYILIKKILIIDIVYISIGVLLVLLIIWIKYIDRKSERKWKYEILVSCYGLM